MTRQHIQAVQDHLDKYADDREIDYLFMAFDRNTELMTADYQINEYSDDLAEGIAKAIDNSPSFATFMAHVIANCRPDSYSYLLGLIGETRHQVMSVDNQAQKMARKLLTGEVTMSDIEPDLQKTGNPNIDTQIDEFRYLLAHYYNQFLNDEF